MSAKKYQDSGLCGIIPVMKPQGWTSFDVVAKLRGLLKTRRIGHGGTLDPMATGVLPVFVGKAAKCCDILPDKRKSYTAGFRLGEKTDTLDITGNILSRSDKSVSADEITAVLLEFTGEIMQIPPMFSAVKIDGKKLCDMARRGETVERKPRRVFVESIELAAYDEASREGVFRIDCGKGTYVRTIIDDIGERLGAGGVMTSLSRTYSGGFSLEECLTLERIAKSCAAGRESDLLLPTDLAFRVYPEARLGERETAMYKNGVRLRREQVELSREAETYRVCGADGEFLGLGGMKNGEFVSVKNFF
ncbi:MAG: tRNA pseudouridine(55) synthase TruB [Ruminococcus sp.]|nr:tRNA pseudouridine(55) synthase TruB [Ruminococcus sp.]